MKKIRAAVVGYGNIGHYSVQALEAADDFEIAGIVRRQGDKDKPQELAAYTVTDDIKNLKDVDVAILATPTRLCPEYADKITALGINTVGLIRHSHIYTRIPCKPDGEEQEDRHRERYLCRLGPGF